MLESIFIFIIVGLFSYSFWKWATSNQDYFKVRNIASIPSPPLIGNTFALFMKRTTMQQFVIDIYNHKPEEKIVGMFDIMTPVYILRDLDIIKKIVIKDFDHFMDHKAFLKPESDKLFGNSLFIMKGDRWRDMRATLSPAFTSSKMRQMFDLVVECAKDTSEYYEKRLQIEGNREVIDVKESFSRFTNDVIATCAFGIKINSLLDRDNEFYKIGRNFSSGFNDFPRVVRMFMLRFLPPSLTQALKIEFFEPYVRKFFNDIVLNTMAEREKKGIFRPDMINILMQIRKGTLGNSNEKSSEKSESSGFATVEESEIGKSSVKRHWLDEELVSQAFIFFLAGFDTTSTTLQFMIYELMANPDIQEKLQQEIDDMDEQLSGKPLSYDSLGKLTYMDMVTSEVLRKWSPVPATDRQCVKDYHYSDGEFNFHIKKDEAVVWIPVWAMHHDPKYYPDPEKFDPERFSEANKHNINPVTYLPFGIGPRNCIGSRFALMEIKAIMYYMLRKFNFVQCEKTQIPLVLAKAPFAIIPEKPVIVELKLRK